MLTINMIVLFLKDQSSHWSGNYETVFVAQIRNQLRN